MLERVEELVETPSSLSSSSETSNWNESGLQAIASLKQMAEYLEVFLPSSVQPQFANYLFLDVWDI